MHTQQTLKTAARKAAMASVAALCAAMTCSAPAQAESLYLTGAQIFSYRASNDMLAVGWHFSTNSSTGDHQFVNLDLQGDGLDSVNQTIAIALHVGDNVFDWSASIDSPMGMIAGPPQVLPSYGLNLFFGSSGTSYNPAASGTAIPGQLTAKALEGANTFSVPVAGTDIAGYNWDNTTNSFPVGDANGATSASVGGYMISISSFSVAARDGSLNDPRGQLTLTVTAVPEPAGYAMMVAGLVAVGVACRRRIRETKATSGV